MAVLQSFLRCMSYSLFFLNSFLLDENNYSSPLDGGASSRWPLKKPLFYEMIPKLVDWAPVFVQVEWVVRQALCLQNQGLKEPIFKLKEEEALGSDF